MYNTSTWNYPSDPNVVDWRQVATVGRHDFHLPPNPPAIPAAKRCPTPHGSYVGGATTTSHSASDLDNAQVSEYYGRLLSWMVNGNFTDEFGVVHTGGPQYDLAHWEGE
jgi:hypothetical protein